MDNGPTRVSARHHRCTCAKARGEEPLDMGEWGAAMTPIARLDPSGKLATDKETVDKILKLGKKQANS